MENLVSHKKKEWKIEIQTDRGGLGRRREELQILKKLIVIYIYIYIYIYEDINLH